MRFLFLSALKDLRLRVADPLALLIWIALPALIGTLVSLLNAGGGPALTAHVLVADHDDSLASNLVLGALRQDNISQYVSIEPVDAAAGQERIDDGDGTALLIVPAGFGGALLNDEPTELELVTNPSERILPALVIEGIEVFGELAFYGQRMLGEPPGTLAPPIIELDLNMAAVTAGTEAEGGFDFGRFILPGILFMSILFIAQGLSVDFWNERSAGTLRRAVQVPHSLALFIGGKLLAGLVLIALVALVAAAIGSLSFGVAPGRAALAVLWSTYAGAALLGLFLLVTILCTSQRAASVASSAILFPLLIVGGSFLPFEAMPDWMRAVGVWTPNGVAVVQLRELLFGAVDPTALGGAIIAIGATLALTLVLCARRLRDFARA